VKQLAEAAVSGDSLHGCQKENSETQGYGKKEDCRKKARGKEDSQPKRSGQKNRQQQISRQQ
jgi:hypothetical protein